MSDLACPVALSLLSSPVAFTKIGLRSLAQLAFILRIVPLQFSAFKIGVPGEAKSLFLAPSAAYILTSRRSYLETRIGADASCGAGGISDVEGVLFKISMSLGSMSTNLMTSREVRLSMVSSRLARRNEPLTSLNSKMGFITFTAAWDIDEHCLEMCVSRR